MGGHAERVYTDSSSCPQLELLVAPLQGNRHVILHRKDGSLCEGLVTIRPNVQLFRAVVPLERSDVFVRPYRAARRGSAG